MKIHVLSDIHLEFGREEFDHYAAPEGTDVVVLAGDISTGTKGVEWAKATFACPVIYVPGNHEFYGGHLVRALEKMRAAASDSVHVMDCEEIILGGVRFLAATGWTDYSATGNVPMAAWDAQQSMRDFKKIRTGDYRRTHPKDFSSLSQAAKRWLRTQLDEPFDGQTVVVTHHAPSLRSLEGAPEASSHLDAAYANRWEDLMGPQVVLWLHGHTHHPIDYEIDGTHVLSRPVGYPGEDLGFDPCYLIEIENAWKHPKP